MEPTKDSTASLTSETVVRKRDMASLEKARVDLARRRNTRGDLTLLRCLSFVCCRNGRTMTWHGTARGGVGRRRCSWLMQRWILLGFSVSTLVRLG
ncbi:hypothetical protein ES288_D02G120600v1 [Gossypium darwinii]|uniref:Uncharacterized protein n=2 Tax=Gossypium TaxID=3633 RepID=A0A5D2DCS2_GOSDA|nr:hypothetical protein ES288_D02G120600v1 [Gossypium darwinii]